MDWTLDNVISVRVKQRPLGAAPLGLILAIPLLLLPLGGWFVDSSLLTLAECGFKVMFDIPCMGCGATRATMNLLHGDWWEALTFQPLIVSAYVGFAIWGLVSFLSFIRGKEIQIDTAPWLTWTVRILLICSPFANWAYLISRHI